MKRLILLIAVGSIAFGLVYGSAATLNATPSSLGAGVSAVTACGSVTKVEYTTVYNSDHIDYDVTEVTLTLSATNSCENKVVSITLATEPGAVLGTGTATFGAAASPASIVVSITGAGAPAVPVSAQAVYNTAIVIQ
jgi:hypothetical protein